jgi:hypothetical protein
MRSVAQVLFLAAVLAIVGCKPKGTFRVQVVTPDGNPVEGARVMVGCDSLFTDTTDVDGFVSLPNWADSSSATITKTNYRSTWREVWRDLQVTFAPMPESLRQVGMVEGDVVLFGPETLTTVTDSGLYRVYTYSETQVEQVASLQLPPVRHKFVRGDTLWCATRGRGLYAYSLSSCMNPVELLHVDVSAIGRFTVIDTFVVVGMGPVGPLRIYGYGPDGSTELICSFGNQAVYAVAVVSHYVVALGESFELPVIFDISDIRDPREIYHGIQVGYDSGFVRDSSVVLIGYDQASLPHASFYGVIDLIDPAHPVQTGLFRADARLSGILNDSMAVGEYDLVGISILRGNITEGFHSVALVQAGTDYRGSGIQGCRPPYYVLCGSLWKLVGEVSGHAPVLPGHLTRIPCHQRKP